MHSLPHWTLSALVFSSLSILINNEPRFYNQFVVIHIASLLPARRDDFYLIQKQYAMIIADKFSTTILTRSPRVIHKPVHKFYVRLFVSKAIYQRYFW